MIEEVKVYITKYALTAGILEQECSIDKSDNRFATHWPKGQTFPDTYGPSHWHRTKEEAVAIAEQMRQKKIASLRKQIKALEQLKFD